MRLLIITQALDLDDPVLSVYHRWVEELLKRSSGATVICLKRGRHTIQKAPVFSLGKEEGASRIVRVLRLFWIVLRTRQDYDTVFVHMNQEYILAAGWLWKLLGKRIYLWCNHYAGSMLTDIAALFCEKVFCTSRFSYTARYKKTVLMPIGVDTELFKPLPEISRSLRSMLFFGRLAKSKRPELFLRALHVLKTQGISFSATLQGPGDLSYIEGLRHMTKELGIDEVVRFMPGVPHHEAPRVFNAHELFVNLSPSGMFDKTMFEAFACGALVLFRNEDLSRIGIAGYIERDTPESIAESIKKTLELPPSFKEQHSTKYRELAFAHSIRELGKKLMEEMSA